MGDTTRRSFLKVLGLTGIGTALGLAKVDQGLSRVKEQETPRPESLESIAHETPAFEKPDSSNEWYIQYSVNLDRSLAERNRNLLTQLGFNNIKHIDTPQGIKTLIGKYSSMEEAVQEAERLKGLSNEVGIVQYVNGNSMWNLTVNLREKEQVIPLSDVRWHKIPQWFDSMVENFVKRYNLTTAGYEIRPEWVKAILTIENEKYDPNAIGYKLKVVSKDGKYKLLVRRKDKDGKYIPISFGLGMLTKLTMKEMGLPFKDRFDPEKNLWATINYFGKLLNRFDGDLIKAVAAYNAGPDAVKRYAGIPKYFETQGYIAKFFRRLAGRTN